MPLIKSAIKKMRKDKKRTKRNIGYIEKYKRIFKELKKGIGDKKKLISEFYSIVDKAVKRKIIHKNKGSRLKSKVGQFLKKLTEQKKTSK